MAVEVTFYHLKSTKNYERYQADAATLRDKGIIAGDIYMPLKNGQSVPAALVVTIEEADVEEGR